MRSSHPSSGLLRKWSELAETLAVTRKGFFSVGLFSLIINVLMLASPLYMLQVMDRVLSSGQVETLAFLTIIAAVAIGVMCVLDTLRSALCVRIAGWLSDRLGPVFLESGVRARLKGSSDGAQTLRDVGQIKGFISNQGLTAFFDSPWVPFFVLVIWLLHPALGVIALVSAILLLLLAIANERVTTRPTEAAHQSGVAASRLADATIRNAEVVRAMGLAPAMLDRWRGANEDANAALTRAGEAGGVVLSVTKFVRHFVQIAVLGAGAYLVLQNELTAGGMIAASILLGRALAPVELAIGAWKGFVSARLAYRRLESHLDEFPPEPERMALPPPRGHLEVESASYVAPVGGSMLLSQVGFDIAPGEAVAVIGPSGAGKSTLCRLLVGVAEPTVGRVTLDGAPLHHWSPEQLGRHIGFLPQDVELFAGTVAENIARMGDVDPQAVLEAAATARAHDVIQSLPDGYATEIGDGGVRLSGGQRQRVGLARAVFGRPRLVVLDEPNANLDQVGEDALTAAIAELKARDTALVIVGHRPSTLAQADKILFLSDGVAAMFGPRDEVLESLGWPKPEVKRESEDKDRAEDDDDGSDHDPHDPDGPRANGAEPPRANGAAGYANGAAPSGGHARTSLARASLAQMASSGVARGAGATVNRLLNAASSLALAAAIDVRSSLTRRLTGGFGHGAH